MKEKIEALVAEAHACWEIGDLIQAASLFLAADALEREWAVARNSFALPDRGILFRGRAAFCFWDAGEFEKARPLLHEVIGFDWKGARMWADRRDTEKAYARLVLEAAAKDEPYRFEELWAAATSRGKDLESPFPSIIPEQKKLLAAALTLKNKSICQQILGLLNPKLLAKHHDLQLLRRQAEALCNEA